MRIAIITTGKRRLLVYKFRTYLFMGINRKFPSRPTLEISEVNGTDVITKFGDNRFLTGISLNR